jgi:hypothetical protein
MENGALDRKLWLRKLWRVKMVFLEGSEGICGVFEWLEALVRKNSGSCEV